MRLLSRRARVGLGLGGGVCLAVAAVGGLANPARFFQGYLIGYTFWVGLALGCLGLALIHVLTGGRWGLATRRIFESGAATLPVLALLFLPILAGLPSLYPWTATSDSKSLYLNVPFFGVRAVLYFGVWIGISRLPRRWSVVGLMALGLTASFAAIDWWMSLEPAWFSTMYPPMICIGEVLVAMASAVLLVTLTQKHVAPGLLNDLGSLLLAFVMLWAYMTFFQYMLIWSGNLKGEITWYVRRTTQGWEPVAWSVAGVGFVLPFSLLLFRGLKRDPRWLAAIAGLLVCARMLEVYWLIEPAFAPSGPVLDWMWPLVGLGIGGIWMALFTWRLAAAPIAAADDAGVLDRAEAASAPA
ncbi:MAG: hypothetical protein M3069_31280 [Chloroflexota bacterium]|nr:hypothetical protein [Chloroflexota bacterium]